MAVFNKFHCAAQDIGRKVHDLHNDALKVYLTNATPDPALDAVKADLAEIAAGNGYAAGGPALIGKSYAQTAGVGKLVADDITITAAGGSIGPFLYAVLYNSTPAAGPLLGYWEYPSGPVTLLDQEFLTIDFSAAAGLLTI